jgi:hypothetical protein
MGGSKALIVPFRPLKPTTAYARFAPRILEPVHNKVICVLIVGKRIPL